MAPREQLILYTRPDCHLCELAAAMLEAAGLRWRAADIESSPELEREYGLRVPVVRRVDTGGELDFPFDQSVLTRFADQ
jgi:hypothetical protein